MSDISLEIINDEIILIVNEVQPGDVTEDGTQALTNKSIALGDNTVTGTKAQFNTALTDGDFAYVGDVQPISANLTSWSSVAPSSKVDATGGTASNLTINDYTEKSFTVTGTTPALSPTNGPYQTWTLTANSTPTAGTWANGQSLTLHIDDGTSFVISSWAAVGVTWRTDGGLAPSLRTTGMTIIQLWKNSGVLYGARVGDA